MCANSLLCNNWLKNRHCDYLETAKHQQKHALANTEQNTADQTRPPQPRSIIDGDILFFHSRLCLTTIVLSLRMQQCNTQTNQQIQYNTMAETKNTRIYTVRFRVFGFGCCVPMRTTWYICLRWNSKEANLSAQYWMLFAIFVCSPW